MRIVGLGVTPVKGMAHPAPTDIELTPFGPRGDRRFCLVDPGTGQVLRTVADDRLMACRAAWTSPVLTIETPIGDATGKIVDGAQLTADYWGREVAAVRVEGAWTQLLSRYLGRPVVLCRVLSPGAVVWAGSVSVVTTSSLAEVARRLGSRHENGERFRPTVVVDTGASVAAMLVFWPASRPIGRLTARSSSAWRATSTRPDGSR